jgi:MerR family transcriptional regulator, light-induced transcriptional regulator
MDPVDELWQGIESFDEPRADRALVGLLWDVPLSEALTRVVIPFLARLGDRWEDGSLSVAHEHFASNLLRRRLAALSHQQEALPGSGPRRPRVLLACPPGERHDLILLCFSLLLGERGWRTLFLGADTPVTALASAARTVDADAVVLAATRRTALTAHGTSIARLAVDHPVYVAGRGADDEVARVVGARLLPADLVEALEELGPRDAA